MNSSLDLLAESLDMKIDVLKEIESYNNVQRKAFEEENADIGSFDDAMAKKDELIDRLENLDSGFETLYEKLADELKDNREKYKREIKELQQKIQIVTELSVKVQASEARNKKLIEQYFAKERKNVKNSRIGSKVAFNYYKNMSGMSTVGPQFMDEKN